MWGAAAMLTTATVLFIGMGLEGEIERVVGIHLRVLSCPKCCTFWTVLVLGIVRGAGFVETVTAAFLFSYAALWLSLGLDALAKLYNRLYDEITTQAAADEADPEATAEAGSDALP